MNLNSRELRKSSKFIDFCAIVWFHDLHNAEQDAVSVSNLKNMCEGMRFHHKRNDRFDLFIPI